MSQIQAAQQEASMAQDKYWEEKKAVEDMLKDLIRQSAASMGEKIKNDPEIRDVAEKIDFNFNDVAQNLYSEAERTYKNLHVEDPIQDVYESYQMLRGSLEDVCYYSDNMQQGEPNAASKVQNEMEAIQRRIQELVKSAALSMIDILNEKLPNMRGRLFFVNEGAPMPKDYRQIIRDRFVSAAFTLYSQDETIQSKNKQLIDAITNKVCPAHDNFFRLNRMYNRLSRSDSGMARSDTDTMDITSYFQNPYLVRIT
jgi:hypothetical protein